MQVAAMQQQVRRAVSLLGLGAEAELEQMLARVPYAVGPGRRLEADLAQQRLQPERAQHPHGIGAHLNTGADPQELFRLLVDRNLCALPSQERGDREPADSRADDCKARFCAQGGPPIQRACRMG